MEHTRPIRWTSSRPADARPDSFWDQTHHDDDLRSALSPRDREFDRGRQWAADYEEVE
jgi:hypothetical protein